MAARSAVLARRVGTALGRGAGWLRARLHRPPPGDWGEAAVRFLPAGPANPHGGHVEVKVVDPSANPYLASAAILGTALTALTIAQGSIWGKPTWGVWWTWDPRLTTTAIMLLIYVGYLALRAFTDDPDRAARWAAAVGVLGFINVPIVYMSVRWWRTIHQVQSTSSSVDPSYRTGLLLNVIAMTLVVVYFILERAESARLEQEVDAALERRMLGGAAAGA